MLRRNNLPGIENSNGCTSCDRVPLAATGFGWTKDKVLNRVMWVLDPNIRQFAKIVGIGLDL